MTESCSGCGAELYAGQQFCRRCGAPTRQFSTAEIPTQILPDNQPGAQQQHTTGPQPSPYTTPLGGRDTDPVYPSRFAQYHQPPAAAHGHARPAQFAQETVPLARRRRRWPVWFGVLALLVALLCVATISGARFASQFFGQRRTVVRRGGEPRGALPVPPIPPMPAVPGVPGLEAPRLENAQPLGEEGAEVSGDKTIITRTYPLKAGAGFALAQVAGDVTIEGWDGAEAQVTITKRGGTAEQRSDLEILHETSDRRLGFKTEVAGSSGVREVEYEIKLPRTVRQIEISAQSANVTLSNLGANVSVSLLRGNVSAERLTGTVNTRTMKGNTEVDMQDVTPTGPQSYSSTKGDVEIAAGGANATLKAETIDGSIRADEDLGLSVQRQVPGEHAAGTLGRGGQSVVVKTISGSVKIKE